MSKDLYWLVDAKTAEDFIELTYIRSPDGEIEVIRKEFTPYFYAIPKSLGTQVSRKELFSGQEIEVAKVPILSPARVKQEWERDLDPVLRYVSDYQLRFGTPHRKTDEGMQLDLVIPTHQQRAFNTQFHDIANRDPMKYQFLNDFFQYTIQRIPPIPRQELGISQEVDETRLYWALMLSRIANLPLKNALASRRVSEWIRSMLYTVYRQLGYLIPTHKELLRGHTPHRVEGALTLAPTPGAYFSMQVLDFESLYPSCIDRYNLSYETVDCGHEECKTNRVPGTDHYVCSKRRGIYSALLGALKDLRINWFKPQTKQTNLDPAELQHARTISDLLKFLLVSSGGVTIRIHGLACPPFAESMMAYGRWALRTSWSWAEEEGLGPVYGDTDSLFLNNASPKQIQWLIKRARDELGLTLARDVVYPLCVLSSAKKAYFGILPDGQPDIKGITLGKSSTPPRFRNIFLKVVKALQGVDSLDKLTQAHSKVVRVIQHQMALLRRREFSLDELEYRVKVWKAEKDRSKGGALAQPYQALEQLSDQGITIPRRGEVGFVKVKSFRYGKRTFSVKPTQMASKEEIDIPDYLRKLELAFQQVLDPLGVQFPREPSLDLKRFLSKAQEDQAKVRKPSEEEPYKKPASQKRLTDYR